MKTAPKPFSDFSVCQWTLPSSPQWISQRVKRFCIDVFGNRWTFVVLVSLHLQVPPQKIFGSAKPISHLLRRYDWRPRFCISDTRYSANQLKPISSQVAGVYTPFWVFKKSKGKKEGMGNGRGDNTKLLASGRFQIWSSQAHLTSLLSKDNETWSVWGMGYA